MKYIHSETGEVWTGAPSTKMTSNFYLLTHDEKVKLGWELVTETPEVIIPMPSVEQLKEEKLVVVKWKATMHIDSVYPIFKQINSSLGIYGEQHRLDMIEFIQNVRSRVEMYEGLISNNQLDFEVVF